MSKRCPSCLEIFDEHHVFCSSCGSRLIDNNEELDSNLILNIGEANAINGGVNINRSKNISTNDIHYHSTTVHERSKSNSELKLEAMNQLRSKAESIIDERGRIDSVAMGELRPFATQLGIDVETFKSIVKEVRSNRNGSSAGLSAANARYLLQAQQALQTNDMEGLSNLAPRLEAMAAISQDENVQYLYYLTLSLLDPHKSMTLFEHQTDDNYWRSFWAIISYIRTDKHKEATNVLALFEPLRFDKSEEDQNLLEAYFNIMEDDKDGAQDFLDDIIGEPSEQLIPFLRAIEISLYEENADSLDVRFYYEQVLSKSDKVIITEGKIEAVYITADSAPSQIIEDKTSDASPVPVTKKEQPNLKHSPQAEALYSEASAASGPKRVMLLQIAAEAGSIDAMYDLSNCYYDGEGVAKNEDLSVKWLTKAADLDHPVAQTCLGIAYLIGQYSVEQNYVLSEKYLKQAAEKNLPEAQAYLSQLYVYMEEYAQAMVWARKAAQASSQEAYSILGNMYLNGLGVESNPYEALTWYEKAAEKGDADAQNIVGNLYSDKEANLLDLDKAFKYYQMSATQSHLYGMFNFGLCYASGDGCEIDMLKAYKWIEKSAQEGCPEAEEWLINNYLEEKPADKKLSNMTPDEEIDYANSISDDSRGAECVAIYRKHANNGHVRGQHNLAWCYHVGFGVKQNYQQAASWYKKAAEQGYALSQLALGLKFDQGYGCGVNYQEAAKWYRKAAEQGDPEAQFRLGLLYLYGNGVVKNKTKALDFIQKSSKQEFQDAINWLREDAKNLTPNAEPNIAIEKVWVDTDGNSQLSIHCNWAANNMKGDCLQFRLNLRAKTGKKIKHDSSQNQWYYLNEKFRVKNDTAVFQNTCPAIPIEDFYLDNGEEKKVEFNIEIFKWGTDECVYSSKKMNFSVCYYYKLFRKNVFAVLSQQCLP
jgi:TPR repeat protein